MFRYIFSKHCWSYCVWGHLLPVIISLGNPTTYLARKQLPGICDPSKPFAALQLLNKHHGVNSESRCRECSRKSKEITSLHTITGWGCLLTCQLHMGPQCGKIGPSRFASEQVAWCRAPRSRPHPSLSLGRFSTSPHFRKSDHNRDHARCGAPSGDGICKSQQPSAVISARQDQMMRQTMHPR